MYLAEWTQAELAERLDFDRSMTTFHHVSIACPVCADTDVSGEAR